MLMRDAALLEDGGELQAPVNWHALIGVEDLTGVAQPMKASSSASRQNSVSIEIDTR